MPLSQLNICDSPLWDTNYTLNSSEPRLTQCFRTTILVWIPSLTLLLATIDLNCYTTRPRLMPISWNRFNISRFILTSILITIKLIQTLGELFNSINAGDKASNGNTIGWFLAPMIQLIGYVILLSIYAFQRRIGIHTNGFVWFFTFSQAICEALRYYAIFTYAPITYYAGSYIFGEYCHFPLSLLLFFLECYGDDPNIRYNRLEDDDGTPRKLSPELTSSFGSRLTFEYVTKYLWHGYKNNIKSSDLWETPDHDKTSILAPRFMDYWYKPLNDNLYAKYTFQATDGKQYASNNVFKVLARLSWAPFIKGALYQLVYDLLFIAKPLLLKYLIRYMTSDQPLWHGLVLASLFMIVPTIQSVMIIHAFWNFLLIGLQHRSSLRGAIYRKSFLLSNKSRQQSTSGEMVNLMSVDVPRFQYLTMYIGDLWGSPIQLIISITMLYNELGWPIFVGLLVMVSLGPLLGLIAHWEQKAETSLMKIKDERMKQINELLGGIKVIKLYAWEKSFMQNILHHRTNELSQLRKIYSLDAYQTFLWNTSPLMVAAIAFTIYILSDKDNVMDAEKAFVTVSLFDVLSYCLNNIPQLFNVFIQAYVASRRLNKFLNSDESVNYVNREEKLTNNNVIWLRNASASWTKKTDTTQTEPNVLGQVEEQTRQASSIDPTTSDGLTLSEINLQVKRASFVAIVGQVGSGKSSLISSLLGQMNYISGNFDIDKSSQIAYVPQEAWIQNMSLRNNIVFCNDYDENKYTNVLQACSLLEDLKVLSGGDEAEIGEKGINLSGGQKQRVSLARACYSNANVFLLDDPLSALDSHVAKHVFDEVMSSKTGLLRDKTRVLATNNLFVLPHVDQIIVMEQGKIVQSGTCDDLMRYSDRQLSNMMQQYQLNQNHSPNSVNEPEIPSSDEATNLTVNLANVVNQDSVLTDSTEERQKAGKLTESELMEQGSVDYKVYLKYFKATSYKILISATILLAINNGFEIGTSVWLSIWSNDANDPVESKDQQLRIIRISGYVILVGLNCLATILASLTIARGAVRASKLLHSDLLERVIHCPMVFFNTTPLGRITNRFAKDIDVIDTNIPNLVKSYIYNIMQVVSSIILATINFPSLSLLFAPLGFVYYLIQKIFIVTTRQLQRLESTTRSPIFSSYSETLTGMPSIKAYDCVDRFITQGDKLVDINNSCARTNYAVNRWLGMRLDLLANMATTGVAVFSVLNKGSITAGLVGLVVSYLSGAMQCMNWFIRTATELETNIVSVERVLEYTRSEQEDDWIKDKKPDEDWPRSGEIDIDRYSTRYRLETPIVLSNISVNIKPGEKIGILGRTGSGKSSLSLSLFRIIEACSGKICIDGEDIAQFGLHDVRSRLTIIPQDPVLFSGTVRFNLDPLKLYGDFEIWQALELAHLRNHISSLECGLDFKVSESGDNFSLGQKQLICLARAILRKSRILVLDEATASVDIETDALVQKTIREVFKDCTILTIAHRIHTILDSDRILVLEKGIVRELDEPQVLRADPNSAFSALLEDAGIGEAKQQIELQSSHIG